MAIKLRLNQVFYFSALLFALFAFMPLPAKAANLFFSPSSGTFTVGKTFTVNIYAGSAEQAANAISGEIVFPADKIEALSVSKAGTIVNLWVQEPSFSNESGSISFAGVVLNPGFTGKSGKIISMSFKAKAAGVAEVSIDSGQILANDGLGTDITTGLGSASFTIIDSETQEKITEDEKSLPEKQTSAGVPAAPIVSSKTHPDQTKWYSNKNPEFGWLLPKDVNGVNVLADRNQSTNPGTKSDGKFNTYQYEDVDEGEWYFHIRLRNDAGWGNISHFAFKIDTEKPTLLDATLFQQTDPKNPKIKIALKSEDKTSGIDRYEISFDGLPPHIVSGAADAIFESPPLEHGPHAATVKTFDKAGNFLEKKIEFEILALKKPKFIKYKAKLLLGEPLKVIGEANPNTNIVLTIIKQGGAQIQETVKGDKSGLFTLVKDKLQLGSYSMFAVAKSASGLESEMSETIRFSVEKPVSASVAKILSELALLLPIILVLLFLTAMAYKYRNKLLLFLSRRKKTKKEQEKNILYNICRIIKECVDTEMKIMEKFNADGKLTKDELKLLNKLKNNLDAVQKLQKMCDKK